MVAYCRIEPDPCCYHYMVLQSLFRNEEGIGGGEAGDYWPGLISFLVMFLHCHLPFLRSREGLRDGTRQRKNKHLLGTFQMTGQGPALRATRKGTCLLTFASPVAGAKCSRVILSEPAGRQGWKGFLPPRKELFSAQALCLLPTYMALSSLSLAPTLDNLGSHQGTKMGSTNPGPSESVSTKGLTSVGGTGLPEIWVGRNCCRLPLVVLTREGTARREEQRGPGSWLMPAGTH